MAPVIPQYGGGSIGDITPSAAAALGVDGYANLMGLRPSNRICLLLVDGLGHRLLGNYAPQAPFLTALTGRRITTGFPSTTATGIASIGTGVPPGEHGIVGLSYAVERTGPGSAPETIINSLAWREHGNRRAHDLRETIVPEDHQPRDTVFTAMAADGVEVTTVTAADHIGSGLSRAALRGANSDSAGPLGDVVGRAVAASSPDAGARTFAYVYHGDLDTVGHVYGPGSLPWMMQLRQVDTLVESLTLALPPDCLLIVTADHGMITALPELRIDLDSEPDLTAGLRGIGGEARARHLYVADGAAADTRAAWSEILGDRAWISSRDEAIAAGWFGPTVLDQYRNRIGDLVVAMRGAHTVVRTSAEPVLSQMLGQHGSLTADEQYVPLLLH